LVFLPPFSFLVGTKPLSFCLLLISSPEANRHPSPYSKLKTIFKGFLKGGPLADPSLSEAAVLGQQQVRVFGSGTPPPLDSPLPLPLLEFLHYNCFPSTLTYFPPFLPLTGPCLCFRGMYRSLPNPLPMSYPSPLSPPKLICNSLF